MLNKIKNSTNWQTKKLPLKILRKASMLFARETGMSGPQITNFFAEYGNHIIDYWDMQIKESRWIIFENCLQSFPYEKQLKILLSLCDIDQILCSHGLPPKEKIEELRKEVITLSGSIVESISVISLNFDFINEQIKKSEDKIRTEDYDGAVTNARSLLETILLHILAENNIEDKHEGDLIKTYKEISKILKLSPNEYQNESLKQILTGCFSIINGLASYRNKASDAHGKAISKYSKIEAHHARFYVNVARSLADFLIDVLNKQKKI